MNFSDVFEEEYDLITNKKVKLKSLGDDETKSSLLEFNNILDKMNKSCSEMNDFFENSYKSEGVFIQKESTQLSSGAIQDQHYYQFSKPRLEYAKKKEKEIQVLFYDLLNNDLAFLFSAEKIRNKIGVPGQGRLKAKNSNEPWTLEHCKNQKFPKISTSDVDQGKELFFNLILDSISNDVEKNKNKSKKDLFNYLSINPDLVMNVLNKNGTEQDAIFLCKLALLENRKQKAKNLGKNVLLGTGTIASIALAFTGAGATISPIVLGSVVGVSAAGEAGLLLVDNKNLKKVNEVLIDSYSTHEKDIAGLLTALNLNNQKIKNNKKMLLVTAIAHLSPVALNWVGKSFLNHPLVLRLKAKKSGANKSLMDDFLSKDVSEVGEMLSEGAKKLEEIAKKWKLGSVIDNLPIEKIEILNALSYKLKPNAIQELLSSMKGLNPVQRNHFIVDVFENFDIYFKNGVLLQKNSLLVASRKFEQSLAPNGEIFEEYSKKLQNDYDKAVEIINKSKAAKSLKTTESIDDYLVAQHISKDSEIYVVLTKKYSEKIPTGKESQLLDDLLNFSVDRHKAFKKLVKSEQDFSNFYDDLVNYRVNGIKNGIPDSKLYLKFIEYEKKWTSLEGKLASSLQKKGVADSKNVARKRIKEVQKRNAVCKSPQKGDYVKDFKKFARDSIALGLILGNLTLSAGTSFGRNDFKNAISEAQKGNWEPLKKNAEYYQMFEGFWSLSWAFLPPSMKFLGNNNKLVEGAVSHFGNLGLNTAYALSYYKMYGGAVNEENKEEALKKIIQEKGDEYFYEIYGEKVKDIAEKEGLQKAFLSRAKDLMEVNGDGLDSFLGEDFKNLDLSKIPIESIAQNEELAKVYESAVLDLDYEVNGKTLNKVLNTGSFETDMIAFNELWQYGTVIPQSALFGHIQHLYCMKQYRKARAIMASGILGTYMGYWQGWEGVQPAK